MKPLKLLRVVYLGIVSIGVWFGDIGIAAPAVLNGKYFMAFHACNTAATSCSDPRNHQVYVAQSDDGMNWLPLSGYGPYAGSVPDLIRRGNTLYVYTPGMLRRYRIDADAWEGAVSVSITHTDGSAEIFVDPSPILDDNGRIVLFYLVGQTGGDPARCLNGQTSCTKVFRSATEVSGSDAAAFQVDNGNRAEITITSSETASDPDIFTGPDGFVLYIARNGGVQALQASDLRGNYQDISGLPNGMLINIGSGSVPSGHYDEVSGQYWTYVHTPQGNTSNIRRAMHSNINTPIPDSSLTTVISGSTFPGLGGSYTVESPGFAVNTTNICAATLSNTFKLHVPIITINSQYFWADFQYVTGTFDFTLTNYGEITYPNNFSSCSPSTFSSDLKLNIPEVFYNDVSYWAEFQYAQDFTFTLTNAGTN